VVVVAVQLAMATRLPANGASHIGLDGDLESPRGTISRKGRLLL